MGSEDYKIVKGFINDDEVLQIVSWVDLLNPEDGDPNYHLSEISKALKGKSCIIDISNTKLTNYITNFQSVSKVSTQEAPQIIMNIFERISKEKEIEYIKNHPNILKQYKQKLTEFLKTVPDLYSGEEFSKEAFPGYKHDIELIDKSISELRAKPYPAQGIRLHQLKSMINDMVKNGVLEPGDSEFLSPVFFVTKMKKGIR